jgi:anthranilate synthase component 2
MHVLLIDNYDSFTFNLVHYLESFDCKVTVKRNDEVTLTDLFKKDALILSPGPGLPADAGQLMLILKDAIGTIPILGVCLGMQAIALTFGDNLYNQANVKHGVQELCSQCSESILYVDIPTQFKVGLYHSWAVQLAFDSPLMATSFSQDSVLMSLEHKELPIFGLQYHPESIMTEVGKQIIFNFLAHLKK